MNNIYYALFINADGSDEGMLTPNQLVGIFEREQLLSILRRELMLGHIHGDIPNDIDDADCPPDLFAEKVLAGLYTDNVWIRMVAPNVEDFDSDNGTFINLEGMNEDEQEELIAKLVEQGADEEELRAMIARMASDASDDSEGTDDTPAEEEPLTPLAAGYVAAAEHLLRMAGIDHYEYHQESSDKMPQREADKKKLLQLLYEYATEKCTARKGDCGDSLSDACPFNEGAQEGMRWCGMYTILHELGEEVGDMSVCDKFDKLSFDNE